MFEIGFEIINFSLYYLLYFLLIKLSCAPHLRINKKIIGLISTFVGISLIMLLGKVNFPALSFKIILLDGSIRTGNYQTEKIITDVLFFFSVIFLLEKSKRIYKLKYMIPITLF